MSFVIQMQAVGKDSPQGRTSACPTTGLQQSSSLFGPISPLKAAEMNQTRPAIPQSMFSYIPSSSSPFVDLAGCKDKSATPVTMATAGAAKAPTLAQSAQPPSFPFGHSAVPAPGPVFTPAVSEPTGMTRTCELRPPATTATMFDHRFPATTTTTTLGYRPPAATATTFEHRAPASVAKTFEYRPPAVRSQCQTFSFGGSFNPASAPAVMGPSKTVVDASAATQSKDPGPAASTKVVPDTFYDNARARMPHWHIRECDNELEIVPYTPSEVVIARSIAVVKDFLALHGNHLIHVLVQELNEKTDLEDIMRIADRKFPPIKENVSGHDQTASIPYTVALDHDKAIKYDREGCWKLAVPAELVPLAARQHEEAVDEVGSSFVHWSHPASWCDHLLIVLLARQNQEMTYIMKLITAYILKDKAVSTLSRFARVTSDSLAQCKNLLHDIPMLDKLHESKEYFGQMCERWIPALCKADDILFFNLRTTAQDWALYDIQARQELYASTIELSHHIKDLKDEKDAEEARVKELADQAASWQLKVTELQEQFQALQPQVLAAMPTSVLFGSNSNSMPEVKSQVLVCNDGASQIDKGSPSRGYGLNEQDKFGQDPGVTNDRDEEEESDDIVFVPHSV